MSTVEDFRQKLIDSQVLSGESADAQLAAWRASGGQEAPEAFIDWLIDQNVITEFQGDAIAHGHSGPFLLGPYRVYEQVAPGLLGGLFRAVQEEFNQPVTLKIFPSSLRADAEKVARMGRELRIFASLDHPHVLRSFQVGQVGNVCYMALEDLKGESLATRLEREKRLPFAEACRIIRDVANGLAYLHKNDIVHRDLRPAHIWLTESGVPKIIEFGSARDAFADLDVEEGGGQVTMSSSVIGDYAYIPPEQASDARSADRRSDIYALGCTLFHCLAGQPPFVDKNPVKLVLRHAREAPPSIHAMFSDVPAQLDETLAGMLAKDPDQRFQKASEAAFALANFVPPEPERVVIVEVSSHYLEWAKTQQPEPRKVDESAVGMNPELTRFLIWAARRKKKRK